MILVYGSAGSGKSEAAENIIVSLAKKWNLPLVYMATMENTSEAAKERIKRHRKLRERKGFFTIEEMKKLSSHASEVEDKCVLVECMSNLVANIFFSDEKEEIKNIKEDVRKLLREAKEVVIVTNNIFEEGKSSDEMCDEYMKTLAKINMELADEAECVLEICRGEEIFLKGDKCWT